MTRDESNAIAAHDADEQHEVIGLLADFATPDALMAAAREMREAGYHRLEAYTPFPIHGLDKVLRIAPSPLPWIVLAAGVGGGLAALVGQWWTNAVDYPFVISGKPLFSLPANIPVAFEVIILLGAFATFFGMLALNRLPRWSNPLFERRRFRRATSHRFVLLVDAEDPRFAPEESRQLLLQSGAASVELCTQPAGAAQTRLPRAIPLGLTMLAALALLPPLWIARARERPSELPRLHLFKDMDSQPKFKPQTRTTLFADGRAMRPPVAGTIARGELFEDVQLYQGIAPSEPTSGEQESEEVAWTRQFPLPATDELMHRGRQRYNIFCATCHGRAGDGDGIVSLRALQLEQGTWVPPTSLHSDHVRAQADGQLFHTISHGVRKMPGYAAQISVPDRWAIVLYVRALQRSQNARLEDVPQQIRQTLRDLN